jgi:hypothetical protein
MWVTQKHDSCVTNKFFDLEPATVVIIVMLYIFNAKLEVIDKLKSYSHD